MATFADEAHQGEGGPVSTSFKRHHQRSASQTDRRRLTALMPRLRALGERAVAALKCRKVLVELHCCPRHATASVAGILVLHHIETSRQTR